MSLSPHDTLTGWNGNSSSTATNSPVFWSNTVGMTRTQSIQVTGGNVGRAMYRSDVMIGPSDAVYCNWFDNGGFGYTAVVQYCFVTVNE
jgi:hypothetical protein